MILTLPLPPSVNQLYRNIPRGRAITAAYKNWLVEADKHFLTQKRACKPVVGKYKVKIWVPLEMRGDIDNRQKSILDFLVSRELTSDDRNLQQLAIARSSAIEPGFCDIEVRQA